MFALFGISTFAYPHVDFITTVKNHTVVRYQIILGEIFTDFFYSHFSYKKYRFSDKLWTLSSNQVQAEIAFLVWFSCKEIQCKLTCSIWTDKQLSIFHGVRVNNFSVLFFTTNGFPENEELVDKDGINLTRILPVLRLPLLRWTLCYHRLSRSELFWVKQFNVKWLQAEFKCRFP